MTSPSSPISVLFLFRTFDSPRRRNSYVPDINQIPCSYATFTFDFLPGQFSRDVPKCMCCSPCLWFKLAWVISCGDSFATKIKSSNSIPNQITFRNKKSISDYKSFPNLPCCVFHLLLRHFATRKQQEIFTINESYGGIGIRWADAR